MTVVVEKWIAVIFLLTTTALYIEFFPTGNGTQLRKSLEFFPEAFGNWAQIGDEEAWGNRAMIFNDVCLSRKYQNNKKNVLSLYIGYWGKFEHGQNIFGGRNIAPGNNWGLVHHSISQIQFGTYSIRFIEARYKKHNNYVLVSYWYFLDSYGVVKRRMGRLKHALNAILNRRSDVALIKVSSPYFLPEEYEKQKSLQRNFIQEMLSHLPEYLPYDL